VKTYRLTAREVEALTFIFPETSIPTAGERKRGSGLFCRVWALLRKQIRVAAPGGTWAD
jgi:hypothetical protein